MNRAKLRAVISAVLEDVDYDLWKSLFVEECREDPDEAEAAIEHLLDVADVAIRELERV